MVDMVQEQPVRACPGDEIAIIGPREGVGGYSWRVRIDPRLGLVTARTVLRGDPSRPGEQAAEAAPKVRFVVTISGRHNGDVRLLLQRPWEKAPIRVVAYPITCD
ncbi:hypothetical protein QNA08_13760 [Chelatococcus sp. SYSU_G07232]|uniref:Proteinase inhibitor I42 chagasin domain-containing protein n=1 Tax=Chelatococcus albus TaxID=3047466 RepID=A0ABT7AIU2_9HYPH|nr:hypothetical protein [Chelatococcus sp. SYSU_G07232]MDJ1159301.1 hypothetical protein [Chelatococcus sp. SYSU_G07232]